MKKNVICVLFLLKILIKGIHNLCFGANISKKIFYPCKPHFNYIKWGLRGSKLYGHVSMMVSITFKKIYLKGYNSGDDYISFCLPSDHVITTCSFVLLM